MSEKMKGGGYRCKDFEDAVRRLERGIRIDEMVLRKGNVVRAVYGHGGHWWLKWDEAGRCYNCVSAAALDLDKFLDPRKEVENWDRCALYDLTFDD